MEASKSPHTCTPSSVYGNASATRLAKSRNAIGCSKRPTRPNPTGWTAFGSSIGTSGRWSTSPNASAAAMPTPRYAASALVCPTHNAQPARLSFLTISPRKPKPETACTERKNSGWWQISRSMPASTACSTTAIVGSAANAMLRTSWRRSPTISPGSSHFSAYRSGYSVSSTSTTCLSVAMNRASFVLIRSFRSHR